MAKRGRLVILPSLPANVVQKAVAATIVPVSFNDLRVRGDVVCYVRHQPTIEVLKKHFPGMSVSKPDEQYVWDGVDVLLLVGLKRRVNPGEEVQVTEKDLSLVVISPMARW